MSRKKPKNVDHDWEFFTTGADERVNVR